MVESLVESLYKSAVVDNMQLYRQFFADDQSDEGTIEYWRQARALYHRLDAKDKETLFAIIESTIVDSVSTVLGMLDGSTAGSVVDVQVMLDGKAREGELQDAFLAHVEELGA